MSPGKSEDKKTVFAHEKFIMAVMTIATTALLAQATMSIQTYRELGVIQWQLSDLQKTRDTYVTKADLDGRAKIRDIEYKALENRMTQIEALIPTGNTTIIRSSK